MKLAKIFLPLSILSIIGIACLVLLGGTQLNSGDTDAGAAIGFVFVLLFNIVPLIAYIPFGLAFMVCEICLFAVPKKNKTMIAVIVLKSLLLVVVLYNVIFMTLSLIEFSPLFATLLILCGALYLASLVIMFVDYFKNKKKYE